MVALNFVIAGLSLVQINSFGDKRRPHVKPEAFRLFVLVTSECLVVLANTDGDVLLNLALIRPDMSLVVMLSNLRHRWLRADTVFSRNHIVGFIVVSSADGGGPEGFVVHFWVVGLDDRRVLARLDVLQNRREFRVKRQL